MGLFPGRGTEGAVSHLNGDSETPRHHAHQSTRHHQCHEIPQVLHQRTVRRRRPPKGTRHRTRSHPTMQRAANLNNDDADHSLVSIPFSSMFELSASRATRGHPFKLAYPDSRSNVRANSFPVRVIALWNRLPEYVVMTSRLTTFKRLLQSVNMSYVILGLSLIHI